MRMTVRQSCTSSHCCLNKARPSSQEACSLVHRKAILCETVMRKIPPQVIALLVAGHEFGINCTFRFKTLFYSHYKSNTQLLLELWKIKRKQRNA